MEVFESTFKVPLKKNVNYHVRLTNMSTAADADTTIMSDPQGFVTISIPDFYYFGNYDSWYSLTIREGTESGPVALSDTITRVRQYAPTDKIVTYMKGKVGPAEAVEYESIARMLINAIVGFDFDFRLDSRGYTGNGTDVLVLDTRLHKPLGLMENNVQIWSEPLGWTNGESQTAIPTTRGGGYIFEISDEGEVIRPEFNRMEFPRTWDTRFQSPMFIENKDYVIYGEWGWPVVPEDIQRATLLLVSDIACGTNRYSNKYIDSFTNGTNRVDYFKEVIRGTGNLLVDNILSKYTQEALRVRAL